MRTEKGYGTLHNVTYVLRNTWNWERPIVVFLLLQAIIGMVMPFAGIYIPTVILSGVTGEISFQNALIIVGVMSFVFALCNVVNEYIHAVNEMHLTNNKVHYLTEVFKKKMMIDYQFVESEKGQNIFQDVLNTLFNDNTGVSGMLQILGDFLGKMLGFVLYIGIISILSPWIVVILLVTSGLYFLVLRYTNVYEYNLRGRWAVIDKKLNYLFDKTTNYIYSKDIKLYSMEKWLSSIINSLIEERIGWVVRISRHNFIAVIANLVLLIFRDGLSYAYVFYAIFSGKIQIAEFTLYFGAVVGLSDFITNIMQGIALIIRTSNEVSIIRKYLDTPTIRAGYKELKLDADDTLEIEFHNVSFRYAGDSQDVIKNINLTIHKGEKVALVGENGAGKTTLIKLLCGLYKPTKGEIYLNGIAMSELTTESVYRLYSVVFQSIYVLPMTVAQNIALTDQKQIDLERVWSCLQLSGLGDTIHDLDTPLTKMIDENGVELSGGETQKLMLARAMYKRFAALILDEPTSALDPIAEKELYKVYHTLVRGRTSLFVSHRLASTQFCDRILFLNHGRIEESGTHQELLRYGGKYSELFQIQSQYYK